MTRLRGLLERWESPYWIIAALGTVGALFLGTMTWVGTAEAHRETPPSCYGLGFGCTLPPYQTAMVVVVIFGVWIAGAAAVVALTELFPERFRSPPVRIVRTIFALGAVCLTAYVWIPRIPVFLNS